MEKDLPLPKIRHVGVFWFFLVFLGGEDDESIEIGLNVMQWYFDSRLYLKMFTIFFVKISGKTLASPRYN